MKTFPELLQQIRKESDLTQSQLATVLDVSTILVSMIETGQKEASKNFVIRLAEKLEVQPGSIMPFVFVEKEQNLNKVSGPERAFISLGEKLQSYLIKVKAKQLKKYV